MLNIGSLLSPNVCSWNKGFLNEKSTTCPLIAIDQHVGFVIRIWKSNPNRSVKKKNVGNYEKKKWLHINAFMKLINLCL